MLLTGAAVAAGYSSAGSNRLTGADTAVSDALVISPSITGGSLRSAVQNRRSD
jgi:hypothetical protein